MSKFSAILLVVAVTAIVSGCGQGSPQGQQASHTEATRGMERDGRVINLRAQDELAQLQQEASEAMHSIGVGLRKSVHQHTDELSAFAAEMTEAAKDRAEDIPEAVDRALERHTRRFRDGSGRDGESRQ